MPGFVHRMRACLHRSALLKLTEHSLEKPLRNPTFHSGSPRITFEPKHEQRLTHVFLQPQYSQTHRLQGLEKSLELLDSCLIQDNSCYPLLESLKIIICCSQFSRGYLFFLNVNSYLKEYAAKNFTHPRILKGIPLPNSVTCGIVCIGCNSIR